MMIKSIFKNSVLLVSFTVQFIQPVVCIFFSIIIIIIIIIINNNNTVV